ncbi:hypothetical protein COCC4DRAFT_57873 [Bipolaris maydis ATCC 48331]|uniref:Uncharacterized protein n=2 Tax=Cochliobolus heterostrophus TaxID=5016 RepID=M2UF47_COCH5|nr:uncharacterized protein COCC4DRAFT_57873 [Bipolaris maydis ATCC 48331]EMD92316.1 hypothetical protein COCHEDRAFT_1021151 [Bipolaris maydis C5]ENI08395.1 hypothetical protein COCC4DRAFT_57873 [Bipolaris maydis ATCC 48331]KAJ6210113.1 hypothetical protein PSV09DRAFT_1021151 [Bipolaris maydis]
MGGLFRMLKRSFPKPLKKRRTLPQSTTKSPCRNDEQKVGVIGIDPEKLVKKLELKFPCGFDVHMMHNTYIIQSCEKLTQMDLDECR